MTHTYLAWYIYKNVLYIYIKDIYTNIMSVLSSYLFLGIPFNPVPSSATSFDTTEDSIYWTEHKSKLLYRRDKSHARFGPTHVVLSEFI